MRNDIKWNARAKTTNINQIKKFEEKTGLKFPKTYIKLILEYNGAEILNNIGCFNVYYDNGEIFYDGFGVGAFLAFGSENVTSDSSLIDYFWDRKNNDKNYPFPENLVPIIKDGGGNFVCFDYRHNPRTENPKVVFCFHEGTVEEGNEIFKIANSFDDFLDCLFDDNEDE